MYRIRQQTWVDDTLAQIKRRRWRTDTLWPTRVMEWLLTDGKAAGRGILTTWTKGCDKEISWQRMDADIAG